MTRCRTLILAIALAGPLGIPGIVQAGGEIHGTVRTRDGRSLTGPIRWNRSESFWSDRLDPGRPRMVTLTPRGQRRALRFLFWKIADLDDDVDAYVRVVSVPFGHLSRLERGVGETATLTLKTGETVEVEGGHTSDLGPWMGHVVVGAAGRGVVEVDWEDLVAIEFAPAPEGSRDAERLYGTVQTTAGDFTGFLLWDRDEGMLEDVLDGEERLEDHEIPFRDIAAIERDHRNARVTLRDGRVLDLRGTNDVNAENRGIDVLVDGLGRAIVPWDGFVRVDFAPAPPSPAYEAFDGGRRLRGRVIARDGRAIEGGIAWNREAEWSFETVVGTSGGIQYGVALENVRSIMPASDTTTRVRLKNGALLVLEDEQRVPLALKGVVVRPDGAPEVDLALADVRLVTLLDPR